MKPIHQRLFGCLLVVSGISQAQAALGDSSANDWQFRRLMEPTRDELQSEREGQIMIYDGLTDRQVGRALDENFNRIQSMMFTGIVITDKQGEPKHDPLSGAVLTENDGCGD